MTSVVFWRAIRCALKCGTVAAVAAALSSSPVSATSIPIGTSIASDLIINFDFTGATPSAPYDVAVGGVVLNVTPGITVSLDVFNDLNGQDYLASLAPAFVGPSGGQRSFSYGGSAPFTPGLRDGMFSVGVRIDGGAADLVSAGAGAVLNLVSVQVAGQVVVPSAVPEPASLGLLALSFAAAVIRQLRRRPGRAISPPGFAA